MSRLQQSASSSRYKISSPQPYVPTENQHPPSRSVSDAKQTPNGSPVRPARSRMRDQPSSTSTSARRDPIPPDTSRRGLAPIQTHQSRSQRSDDLPISPISPTVPEPPSLFSDPFAADRSHRTELRTQAKAAATTDQASRDKLRNVVGAFMSAGKPSQETPKRRTPKISNEDLFSGSGNFVEIDNVLRRIQTDWPFVLESDFSASTLALSLLDSSSRLDSFFQLHDALSTALQASVQAHFQSFAASLPAHANFLSTLGRAQQQIRTSKDALREAREGFGAKGKGELAGVRARERQVREMLQILDVIDTLKQTPDQLEALVGDKKFLPAADLLVNSLKTTNKPEIVSIGATSDIRAYLLSQETILTDILVDELHAQLYLKTFESDMRLSGDGAHLATYLNTLVVKASDEIDSAPINNDPFRYVEFILESLSVMGKLGGALETISQRVSTEIHNLIETTLDEVEERADRLDEDIPSSQPSLSTASSPKQTALLRDLIWTLYSKLAAVLEGHRVVYEVSRWISARRDFKDSTQKLQGSFTVPVLEVWKPIQQEVRSILQNYLVEAGGPALDRQAVMSVNEILRDGHIARDRQKPLFRFSETDSRTVNSESKAVDDAIHQTLKTTLPGLITAQDSYLDENLATGGRHRNLIPANPFNVTVLFEPTLHFIDRASSIAPSGFENEPKAFGAVLEEFVVQVFLPQLDEKVTASFQEAVAGYDAYQIDTNADIADRPPLRSSIRVMNLIHSLCFMLQTTPFHRENYSRLIVGVIVQYYQQCSARFKELVCTITADTVDSGLLLPAVWAQREDLIACLTDVRAVTLADYNESALAGQKEIKLEFDVLKGRQITEAQLINSNRKMEALCQLSQSLRWFIDALLDIEEVTEAVPPRNRIVEGVPTLPLTSAMAQRFEAIIQTYEQLTEMVLNTIRLEIRCRVICNIAAVFNKGDFRLESEALEPDPDVTDLAGHLTVYDSLSHKTLSEPDHQFVFRGLSQLVDHMFIHCARSVKILNQAGVQKIRRDILALQQTLRAFKGVEEGVLERSIVFWDMYEAGPKAMLEALRTSRPMFSFDDYYAMLNLQCKNNSSEAPSSELNTYLIDLHALSMSIDGWEIGES